MFLLSLRAGRETIVANCLAHARRQFVEVYDHFPEEVLRRFSWLFL
jgi:hypothetical protein